MPLARLGRGSPGSGLGRRFKGGQNPLGIRHPQRHRRCWLSPDRRQPRKNPGRIQTITFDPSPKERPIAARGRLAPGGQTALTGASTVLFHRVWLRSRLKEAHRLSPRDQSDGRRKNPYGLTIPSDYIRAGALAASREGGPRLLNLRGISHRWEPTWWPNSNCRKLSAVLCNRMTSSCGRFRRVTVISNCRDRLFPN